MNKKLLSAVLLMLVAVAIVCYGAQPPDENGPRPPGGKRSFKVEFSMSNWEMKIDNPNKKID